jgi:anti-sigma factor RsiW
MMSEQRKSPDPDRLVAYADGELPAGEAAAVEAALRTDETAREALRLMRLGGRAVAHAYDRPLEAPVPARLRAAALGRGANAPRPTEVQHWLLPLAAGIACLAIGLSAGYWLHAPAADYAPASAAVVDPLAAGLQSALRGALDKGVEGQSFVYKRSDGGQLQIKLGRSFTTGFRASCREFHRQEVWAGGQSSEGVACRGPDGSWNVMLLSSGG